MSGSPAFQPNAFQQNAFQSGVQVVAGDYYLGSPAFAAPALTYKILIAAPPAYSLGSPAFAAPTLTVLSLVVHANPYWLGSPSFATPTMRGVQTLHVNSYSIGSPSFAAPGIRQSLQHLFVNSWATASPVFATPRLTVNYQCVANDFFVSAIAWPPSVGPILTNHVFLQPDYVLSVKFGYPRLSVVPGVLQLIPATYLTQIEQAAQMFNGYLDLILQSVPPTSTGPDADNVRRLIGALRANSEAAIRGNTLGTDLQAALDAAWKAGATYQGVDDARQYLMGQQAAMSIFTQIVFRSALVMTLALEAKVIAGIDFTNQADVQTMITLVTAMFDDAKALGIDEVDAITYQTINSMAGALTYHLASTELQLPRFLTYTSRVRMPSLYLANRIYADASRYQEIEQENVVIHPMFMPQTIRVLSNV